MFALPAGAYIYGGLSVIDRTLHYTTLILRTLSPFLNGFIEFYIRSPRKHIVFSMGSQGLCQWQEMTILDWGFEPLPEKGGIQLIRSTPLDAPWATPSPAPVPSEEEDHYLIIGGYTASPIGCTSGEAGKADVLAEEPKATFQLIDKAACPVCDRMPGA